MSKINQAVKDVHFMDDSAKGDSYLCQIHPLAKVLVTLAYVVLLVSFDKYNMIGLLGMSIYLIVLVITGEVSLGRALRHLKVILLMVLLVGIANPILDRTIVFYIGSFGVTSGIISMITLMIKAIFAVMASFILIQTTSIESICYALRKIKVPSIIVTTVMLIYRYIVLMLKETERMTDAYKLRGNNQKGIDFKAWGPFVGQMLLRSIDRANRVYESMTLRGFNGEYYLNNRVKSIRGSILYAVVWIVILVLIRIFPIFSIVGSIVAG